MEPFTSIRKHLIRSVSIIVFAFIVALTITPVHSNAGGLVICGSESNETSLAATVNSSGGSAASLAAFNNSSCQFSQLIPEITHIINWLIASAGLVAVTWIVYIGLSMVIFSSDAGKIKSLKGDLSSVHGGLVLIMLAFVLVNTIYAIFQIKINGATGFTFNPFSGQ